MRSAVEPGVEDVDVSQSDWVLEIKEKERNKSTIEKFDTQLHPRVELNYGVMQDFFAYSATNV